MIKLIKSLTLILDTSLKPLSVVWEFIPEFQMAEVARSLATELDGGCGSSMHQNVCLQAHITAADLYRRKNNSSKLIKEF